MSNNFKFSHPFIDGLKNAPENKNKEVQKVRAWMNTQPHLPTISDEYIILFLHACYYQHEKTKTTMENYFTIRANHPAIFSNRDADCERLRTIMELAFHVGNCKKFQNRTSNELRPWTSTSSKVNNFTSSFRNVK